MIESVSKWSRIRRGRGDLPPLLSGLEFFGDLSSPSTSIVSGAVAQLGDASGRGRHFAMATAGSRPTYSASDAAFGGRPSQAFDAVDDYLANTSSYGSGWTGRTVYAVVRQTSYLGDGRIFSGQVSAVAPSVFLLSVTGPAIAAGFANPAGTITFKAQSISNGTTYVVAAAFDVTNGPAAVPRLHINGVNVGSYTATPASNGTSFANSNHGIGAGPTGTSPFNGKIVDPLDYSVTHTTAEMQAVASWLAWRNGL